MSDPIGTSIRDMLKQAHDVLADINAVKTWHARGAMSDLGRTQTRNHEDYFDVVDGFKAGIDELDKLPPDLGTAEAMQTVAGRLGALRSGTRNWHDDATDPPEAQDRMALAREMVHNAIKLFEGVRTSG